jgi:hypothetical protein
MILSIVTSIQVPLSIAFLDTRKDALIYKNEFLEVLNYLFDFFFMTDIVLNFFTTAMDPYTGLELDDKSEIAIQYLSG